MVAIDFIIRLGIPLAMVFVIGYLMERHRTKETRWARASDSGNQLTNGGRHSSASKDSSFNSNMKEGK